MVTRSIRTTPSSTRPADSSGGARRRRLSADEVFDAAMRKARELHITDKGGLTVSLEHINLEQIVAAAGVPRSSAYRLWPTKGDFLDAFLLDLAGPNWSGTAAFDRDTIRVCVKVFQDRTHWVTDAAGRRELLRELVRVGAQQNFDAIVESVEWRTYVALNATVISMADENIAHQIEMKLQEAENQFINKMATFYEGMASYLGFKLKKSCTFERLAMAGAAVVEGLALRHNINTDLVTEPLDQPANEDEPTGPTQPWSLAATGFLGILDSMTEIDPDYQSPDTHLLDWIANAATEEVVEQLLGEPS